MPKVTKTKKVEEEVVETTNESIEETEPEVNGRKQSDCESFDIVIVKDPNDKNFEHKIFVRQYSLDVHGENFEKLADEFCTKKPRGNVGVYLKVPSDSIGRVEVRYREKLDAEKHLDKQDPNAPIVDKVKVFDDKDEAVRFGSSKYDSTVVVSRSKPRL